MRWLDKHTRFRDQLSPYVDGALSPAETTRLEAHLAACDACRADLDELRSTVFAARELPQVDAPRSFALTPRMLQPRTAAPSASAPPLALGMRLASAGVAVVLAVVIVRDLSDTGGGGGARESVDQSRTLNELPAAEADREEAAGGAAVPAPDVTDPAAAFDAQAPREDSPATTAPRVGDDTAACPSGILGESSSGGTSAGGAGGPSSGGGGAGTGAPVETPAATPMPQPPATSTPDLLAEAACEEQPLAGAVTPATSPLGPQSAEDTPEESLSADNALEAEDGGGVSTVRVVEIALAGVLTALLAGVAVELASRRRAA